MTVTSDKSDMGIPITKKTPTSLNGAMEVLNLDCEISIYYPPHKSIYNKCRSHRRVSDKPLVSPCSSSDVNKRS